MKILYNKYINLYQIDDEFFNKYFGRSDSDYSIIINKDIIRDEKEYMNIYYDINILSFNILNKIKDFINYNIDKIVPLTLLTEDDCIEKIGKINKELENIKKITETFNDIEKIIGLTINGKTYLTEDIKIENKENYYSLNETDIESEENLNELLNDDNVINDNKLKDFIQNKKLTINKNKFYRKTIEITDTVNKNSGLYLYLERCVF